MEFLGHLRAAKNTGKVFDNPALLTEAFKEGKIFASLILKTHKASA